MIIVNRIEDRIFGSVDGTSFSVSFDEQKYQAMLALAAKAQETATREEFNAVKDEFLPLTKESFKEIVETASPYLFVNKHNNKYYLQHNKVLSSKPLPQLFVDKILNAVEKNIDITPLIKCWVRFLRNPNYTDAKAEKFIAYIDAPYVQGDVKKQLMKDGFSEAVATERATTTQVAITQEGLLAGYKVSTEILTRFTLDDDDNPKTVSRYKKSIDPDTGVITFAEPEFAEERLYQPAVQGRGGDAFYCIPYGQDTMDLQSYTPDHFIRVGHTILLDNWNKVDCDDTHNYVKGLHVGGLRYIQGYQKGANNITHVVLIDPMDIGAIVGLGTGSDGAIRVRRYFVLSTFGTVNRNMYHSSKYKDINDAEYDVMVQEAVEKTKMDAAASDKLLAEKMSLR